MTNFNESTIESAALSWLAELGVPGMHGDDIAPLGDRPIHRAVAGGPRSLVRLEPCGACAATPVVTSSVSLYRSFSPQQLYLSFDSVSLSQFDTLALIGELRVAAPLIDRGSLA